MALGSPYLFHSLFLPQSLIPCFSFLPHHLITPCLTFSQSPPQHKAPPDLFNSKGFRVCLLQYFLCIHYPTQSLFPDQESSTYQKIPALGLIINKRLLLSISPQQTELQFPTSHPHQVKVDATLSFLFKFPRRWQVQCY